MWKNKFSCHTKTEWATTKLVFLGILLDGENYILAELEEKRLKALKKFIEKKKATVKELQSLARTLN